MAIISGPWDSLTEQTRPRLAGMKLPAAAFKVMLCEEKNEK